MCVNDIVVQGAEPLFFLDYYATGALDVDAAAQVVEGIARACKESGCALIGGETAEMPGLYAKGDFDLAGFAVGAVERGARAAQDWTTMRAGDVLIGVASSGVHSNGYSLVRKVVAMTGAVALTRLRRSSASTTLGDALLTPTRLYVKTRAGRDPRGRRQGACAHHRRRHHRESAARAARRTGCRDRSRMLDGCRRCSAGSRAKPGLPEREMLRTFNCGVGLIVVVGCRARRRCDRCVQRRGRERVRHRQAGPAPRRREPAVRYTGSLRGA